MQGPASDTRTETPAAPGTADDRSALPDAPVEISEEYRRRIAWVEALSENQSGTDKTWVEATLREFREHFQRAVRLR